MKTANRFKNLVLVFSVFILAIGYGLATPVNTAQAADRYWIGGTGNWSSAAHWSATSGGAGGASVPTASDNVFIDQNSGLVNGGKITENGATTQCNNFTSTSGRNYTIRTTKSDIAIYGSAVFEKGLTFDPKSGAYTGFYGTGTHTITINGAAIYGMFIYGTGSFTLQDDLIITGYGFNQANGIFDANDHNVTAARFVFTNTPTNNPTVVMGSGTWTATGNEWAINPGDGVVKVIPEASTIKFIGTGDGHFYSTVAGGGQTYNNVWFAGASSGFVDIYGSNTFNDLRIDKGRTIKFADGSIQTVNTFTAVGTAGNLITLRGTGAAGWTISSSGGTISSDYLDIDYSTGGMGWTKRGPAGAMDNYWQSVSFDSDGSHLIAGAGNSRLYISSDGGATWTERRPAGDVNKYWNAVSSDSDGSNLLAAAEGERLYTSSDGGETWTERQPAGDLNKNWWSVSSDSDGSNLIASVAGGRLYTSADGGVTWTERRPATEDVDYNWYAVSSDSDGSNLIATGGGRLYTSADGGVTWTESRPAGDVNKNWFAVSSDSDGSNLLVGAAEGRLYTSSDGGTTWTERQPAGNVDKYWQVISSDSAGSHLIAGVRNGRLYTSSDGGATWAESRPSGDANKLWFAVSSDSAGRNLIAGVMGGGLYTSINSDALFYAGVHSVDGGHNNGWIFTTSIITPVIPRTATLIGSPASSGYATTTAFTFTPACTAQSGTTLISCITKVSTNGSSSWDPISTSTSANQTYSMSSGSSYRFYTVETDSGGATTSDAVPILGSIQVDITAPTPNPPAIATSNISASSITWTLSTGSDAVANLHATPYGFAASSGGPYTFQATSAWVESNLACGTSYARYGILRDVLGNQTNEGNATISTAACAAVASSGGGGGGGGGGSSTIIIPAPVATSTSALVLTSASSTPATAPAATSTSALILTSISSTPVTATSAADIRTAQIATIMQEASTVSTATPEVMAEAVGITRNASLEQTYTSSIVASVVPATVSADVRTDIVNFVTYGTPVTVSLGAGERAGVVSSFNAAFNKVPQTEADWADVIKIANGRFPSQTNATREKSVESSFAKIYLRSPDRQQANDNAAVTVMAYGLRTATRNLDSEKAAIKSFKVIYGKNPSTATDWDAVRAIAYSGAKR